ncbi:MAG: tat (twin-arginine translocation) pathway signal sequence [Chlorobiaceae bacterium]|nr:tat (twin-arginine translocation) pathway signal sequence [Chlorobiaceae bacterium]MBA4310070.1 tat (twin-arginine translocation) pathway signal sequence [Chlorobiaceae bacterium]
MDRRIFIKTLTGAGVVAYSSLLFPNVITSKKSKNFLASDFDLVAVRGGEPEIMFDRAIESLGGMQTFVKKNQKVLVKPNIAWDVVPEKAANTNPKLVARIIEHCLNAGAKDVYVFDHTCDNWQRAYRNSGIEKAVRDSGGKMVPGNDERLYQNYDIKSGKRLRTTKIHELVFDTDVFINVPILKHHSSTKLTIAMKNLMGIIYDRGYWHKNDLNQCIADFATLQKPLLNVVDCYRVLKRNGPRGVSLADVATYKALVISKDIVAADAASTRIFGLEAEDIPHIRIADQMKVGTKNLSNLKINRINLN